MKDINKEEIRFSFFNSSNIKEIILGMESKAFKYDNEIPEYANAIYFFRLIYDNIDEMIKLKEQIEKYS